MKRSLKNLTGYTVESSDGMKGKVKGYHINASDGRIGHINDIIIDDDDWQLVYVIIDTKNRVPWSREVILSVDILDEINYARSEVSVPLEKDDIKKATEFDPGHPIDMDYEKALNNYYQAILEEKYHLGAWIKTGCT